MGDENNQENAGQGAIQIHGNHNTIHNQHTHHHQHSHTHSHHHSHNHTVHAHGPVHVHTHVEPTAFALQAPPAPPAHFRQRGQPAADITAAQKALLALMRPLPKPVRAQVLHFMRVEFGTGLVVELDPDELQRVRRAVLDARRAAGL